MCSADPDAAAQHLLVDCDTALDDRRQRSAGENALQRGPQLRLPRRAQAVVLQLREVAATCRCIDLVEPREPVLPERAHIAQQRQRLLHAVFEQLGARDLARVVALAERQVAGGEEGFQRVRKRQLVAQAQLDVDALDAFGVLAHARQRDDDVLVDLEGVGVLADRRGALAVEPELLARLGAHGNEALARAALAMRTTSLVARATASASSPTMSPISTIFGSVPRLLFVA